jgi:protein-disulfide isomerase
VSSKNADVASRWLVIGIGSFIALTVLAVLVSANRPRRADDAHMELVASLPRGITPEGLPFLGEEEAPVTMTVYEDLGCPNCRTYYFNTEKSVLEEFVAAGEVKLVIYTVAFVNSNSLPGAEGAACAGDQDKFWEYRDALFNNQGVVPFNRENLINIAVDLGLDRDTFARCFDFAAHSQAIIDRSQTAFEFGINATPTTDVNGERHQGALPFLTEGENTGIQEILQAAIARAQE